MNEKKEKLRREISEIILNFIKDIQKSGVAPKAVPNIIATTAHGFGQLIEGKVPASDILTLAMADAIEREKKKN